MIAGSNGRVLRIFLKQFALHVVDNRCRKEDAHRRLAACQEMELFLLGHGSTAFATCEDNGLTTLRNRKLALQLGSSGQERRDARSDVVVHVVLVEERHLFLNGTKDAGVACVQTDNVLTLVVELLHQQALLFKRHIGRGAHHSTGLVAFCKRLRNQRACIENEVRPFQHLAPTHTHQIGVARTCTDYLDVTDPHLTSPRGGITQVFVVDGESSCPVSALHFGNDEFAIVGTEDGSSLTDRGCAYMFLNGGTGVGHLNLCKLLSRIEYQLFA